MPNSVFDEILTVKEAASELGYTTGYVRRLCIWNEVGRVIGRDRLLTKDDLTRLKKITEVPE
tara:strand:- start:735 stop:920 length:186 start_codon:yes stop_codon:yes gene_type:complete